MRSLLVLISVLIIASCGIKQSDDVEKKGELKVIYATNYPLYFMTKQMAPPSVAVRFPAFDSIDPSLWKPLPRFTLTAQTETVRPVNPTTGQMDSRLAKVYDFAGSPENKPWMSYKGAQERNDPNCHAYFGSMRPGTEGYERYMVPQKVWNQYYDQVLKQTPKEGGKDEL